MNLKKTVISIMAAVTAFINRASAAGIEDSTLGIGIRNMVNDITVFLVILCPLVGGAAAVWFFIRRSMADEQDGKMWTRRIIIAVICGVAGMLVSGIIHLISSYF